MPASFAGRVGSFSGAELNNYWMNLVSSTRVDGGLDVGPNPHDRPSKELDR